MSAAEVGLAGLNATEFLTTEDGTLRDAMMAVARTSRHLRQVDAENLAVLIANAVGKMLGG